MSVTVPFLTTKHFDFTGLNNILAYDTTLLEAMRIMFKPRWTVWQRWCLPVTIPLEDGCCESVAWEPYMDVIEVIYKEVI